MSKKRFSLSERDLNEINNTNAIADDRIPCTQRQIVKLLNELHDENEQLKGEVAHYKLILMSLEQEAKRISKIR